MLPRNTARPVHLPAESQKIVLGLLQIAFMKVETYFRESEKYDLAKYARC
ncbi:hypothetical protein GGE09_001807 [Roseobacter sp. N2S]|nr:hypothetical protein [Roseobacter sp. N2S]